MRKEKSCGCIIFNNQNKVLLIQMKQGHWSFPKGHVEENETELETARRETFEETGINVDIDPNFREVSTYSPFKGVMKDVVFFVAKALNENIVVQKLELKEAKFTSIKKAKKQITFESDLEIFEKALKYLKLE